MATRSSPPTPAAPARRRRTGVRNNEAGHETRARLLDAAERLFAERGLDAVSVRDITEAADANTAAIHYHFGSKRDLIVAILERRAARVGTRREELLAGLVEQEDLRLRDVVRSLVQPTAELASEGEGGRNYVAFLAALGDHADLLDLVSDVYDPYTQRWLQTLARVTPHLPDDVRVLRFAVGKDLVNRMLGQPTGQVHLWIERHSPGADTAITASLVDILVGVFEAPVTAAGGRPRPRRQGSTGRGAAPARAGRGAPAARR